MTIPWGFGTAIPAVEVNVGDTVAFDHMPSTAHNVMMVSFSRATKLPYPNLQSCKRALFAARSSDQHWLEIPLCSDCAHVNVQLPTQAEFEACDFSNRVIVNAGPGGPTMITFDTPGVYWYACSVPGPPSFAHCNAGKCK